MVSHFVLLFWFGYLKDTSDSPLLLRFYNLQKECYTNEAVEAIIEFARVNMKVNKIIGIVYIDNTKCKILLEKFGFKIVDKEECIFRGSVYLHDVYELELLKR